MFMFMFMFFSSSLLLASSIYLYFFCPDISRQILMSAFWNFSIMRSKCEEMYELIHKRFFPKLQESNQFIIYDMDTCEIENIKVKEPEDVLESLLESLKDMLNEKENENKLVLFKRYVNETPYFIRIHNGTNIDNLYNVELIKSPFLNVDLKYINNNDKEETLNITDGLKPYYIKGNVLFDNNFISYFINITYGIDSINSYTLEFIDSNCASLKFTHNDEITQEHVL